MSAAVEKLLQLKLDYKTLTGNDVPSGGGRRPKAKKKQDKPAADSPANGKKAGGGGDGKKKTKLGLQVSKEEDLADWYSQVNTEITLSRTLHAKQ